MGENAVTTHWMALFIAAMFEVTWVSLFKVAGPDRPVLLATALAALLASMLSLWFAMRSIPIGVAYAIWTGIGAAGAMAIGILAYGEALSVWRLASLSLILLGVIGLKMSAA